jgi:hypothetical protein
MVCYLAHVHVEIGVPTLIEVVPDDLMVVGEFRLSRASVENAAIKPALNPTADFRRLERPLVRPNRMVRELEGVPVLPVGVFCRSKSSHQASPPEQSGQR